MAPTAANEPDLSRSLARIAAIIDDVLELSRMESGQMTIAGAVQPIGSAIEEALAAVEPYAAQSGVTVSNAVSGAATELTYWGDEGRVRQILVNLLTNAVKFTTAGGRITISGGTGETVVGANLAGPGPWIFVRVEDTGRGIPPERLDTIFDPFQQSEPTDQNRGTGLGLSIVHELVERHGGTIEVETKIGQGTTFTVKLPRQVPSALRKAASSCLRPKRRMVS